MDTFQNIEQHLKALLTERMTVVDEPVYLWDDVSFPAGNTAYAVIDTRFVNKLSIVCSNFDSTPWHIVIRGSNTIDCELPVDIATLELDAGNISKGHITTELYPFTIIAVTNLNNENAGIVTVSYVTTR
jgi:hypothetical protein